MLIIKRGSSLYEVFEYSDKTVINVYKIDIDEAYSAEFQRDVTISKSEYRNAN